MRVVGPQSTTLQQYHVARKLDTQSSLCDLYMLCCHSQAKALIRLSNKERLNGKHCCLNELHCYFVLFPITFDFSTIVAYTKSLNKSKMQFTLLVSIYLAHQIPLQLNYIFVRPLNKVVYLHNVIRYKVYTLRCSL